MAKFNSFSVAALLACLAIVNAANFNPYTDEQGNPCPPCPTTKELRRVCGSNGQTYLNPSLLKCHSKCLKSPVEQKHFGPCQKSNLRNVQEEACPCATTFEYIPVCGTNGKSYPNKSALRCAAKCQKSDIKVKHQGECA